MSLTFSAPRSTIDPTFWEELYNQKLNHYKLSKTHIPLSAKQVYSDGKSAGSVHFAKDMFIESQEGAEEGPQQLPGLLIMHSTIEDFKECNKLLLIQEHGLAILNQILYSSAENRPDLLHKYIFLCFGDLKKYQFTHWMALPSIVPRDSLILKHEALKNLSEEVDLASLYSLALTGLGKPCDFLLLTREEGVFSSLTSSFTTHGSVYVVYHDEGMGVHLGWRLRNILLYLSFLLHTDRRERMDDVIVVALRNLLLREGIKKSDITSNGESIVQSLVSGDQSVGVRLSLSSLSPLWTALLKDREEKGKLTVDTVLQYAQVIGYEANDKGKAAPRFSSPNLSPLSLLSQASSLHLSLMKWRVFPSLPVHLISRQKVLLLGAGTLGCALGRVLLGYNISSMKIVDRGLVGYSNINRQCLYTASDVLTDNNTVKYKALIAAERLLEVSPYLDIEGVVLSIPMPGHVIIEEEEGAERSVRRLEELVKESDVVFLLTDSREARWLPTVLCKVYDKLCINVALGPDSYLVMHHSIPTRYYKQEETNNVKEYGCYFCNDIISARNSSIKQALDQQCTITKPGLAYMAAGYAVELFVSILSHRSNPSTAGDVSSLPPHQLRGSLYDYSLASIETPHFNYCTACSANVASHYTNNSVDLVKKVSNDPTVLEDISGVKELMSRVDKESEICVWDSDGEADGF